VTRARAAFIGIGVLLPSLPLAYWLGLARAAGVPATAPLWYGGFLTDTAGTPVTGAHAIVIRVFDAATLGNQACMTVPTAMTQVNNGRFRIPLDASCVAAVHANPDLWVEPAVDSTPFPRTKLGAVPYALEAGAVQFGNVGGLNAGTEWPGSISTDRVSSGHGLVRDYASGPSPAPMVLLAGFINNIGTDYSIGAISGAWLSGAPVRNSMGNVTLNFSSPVGGIAFCVGNSLTLGTTLNVQAIASTFVTVVISNNAGSVTDAGFEILCVAK
jgi:hypothetical protein